MRDDTLRDAVIIGGGAAGLSGALSLARARRRVTVVDAGHPRNAPADGVHGLLGLEGTPPLELLARGRAEVESYGGEIITADVVRVQGHPDAFTVDLGSGETLEARRLLIATGLVDELPDVPGVAERWGRGVLHCPYCHGWEVRDQRIGIIASSPLSVHQAMLFSQWSSEIVFLAGADGLADGDRAQLEAIGVTIVDGEVAAVEGDDGTVSCARMTDGRVIDLDAAVVATRMHARVEMFEELGIKAVAHPMGMGSFVEVDEAGATNVPGVWAAGNASNLAAQVGAAAAAGNLAGAHINADLVMADAARALSSVRGEQ